MREEFDGLERDHGDTGTGHTEGVRGSAGVGLMSVGPDAVEVNLSDANVDGTRNFAISTQSQSGAQS